MIYTTKNCSSPRKQPSRHRVGNGHVQPLQMKKPVPIKGILVPRKREVDTKRKSQSIEGGCNYLRSECVAMHDQQDQTTRQHKSSTVVEGSKQCILYSPT